MGEQVIRGYLILGCMDYIESFGEADRERMYSSLADDVSSDRGAYDKMAWYPLKTISELYDAIAKLHPGDEAKAYEALRNCGMFIAEAATNSFLKLLMRVMTPAVFSKKAPDLWARDNRRGRMETKQVDERHLVTHLHEVDGYFHAGPVAAGFGTFALRAVGAKDVDVKVTGWSLKTPCPAEVRLDMTWK
ncbi:MAG: hypothetical protein KF764_27775 [Labilithrix sp.]|nr:hypothetical protein [Labilithrix sp.]MBX3223866.1 hypothetical protein [Labilithrix sp.]